MSLVPGFRSLTYRFGVIYNFLNNRLYDWEKKFVTLAKLVGEAKNEGETLKVLDLACGTGYLARFLHPSVDYEGWDLNSSFLKRLMKDRKNGLIKVKRIRLKIKNVLDFEKYPEVQKDVIVFSGILHHIFPKHVEAVENAKKFAKKLVICEPYAIKPRDIDAHDVPARVTMFLFKNFPERLYKWVDLLFADNDGINSYETRSAWKYNKEGLIKLYRELGIKKIYGLKDECIGIWES